MSKNRIYLDHAATSPLLEEARDAMLPWLDSGNPSSLYAEGRRSKAAIDEARESVSEALGCLFAEALFTSGGTEAANLAILGTALGNENPERKRVLLSAAEHHCVLGTKPLLEAMGFQVELLKADRESKLDLDNLKATLDEHVLLVSAMHANNELGTLNPVEKIAEMVHENGAVYHCDAVQTFGKIPLLSRMPVDLLTISAHKIGGPKATGAIFVRAGLKLKPLVSGGGQEREVRGGTENVAGIVGFGAAVRATQTRTPKPELREACNTFLQALESEGFVATVSAETDRLPTHVHVRLPGVDAETMLIRLDREGVSASSGSACSSGSVEPSHVLLACGYSHAEAKEGLRFTFGPETDVTFAREAAKRVVAVTQAVRAKKGEFQV